MAQKWDFTCILFDRLWPLNLAQLRKEKPANKNK